MLTLSSDLSVTAAVQKPKRTPTFAPLCSMEHEPCACVFLSVKQQEDGEEYQVVMTSDRARKLADIHRKSIVGNHEKFCNLLEGRKDAIIKRWTSWNRRRRLSAIKEACPGMQSSNIMTDCFRYGSTLDSVDKYRTDFLLYPITTELLATNPLALIALAERRSSFRPDEFAAHDMKQLMAGIAEFAFPLTYAPGCIRAHAEWFGYFDEKFRAADVHCKHAYPTSVGLLILERQATVLQMLCNVMQRLTTQLACGPTSETWNLLTAQKFQKPNSMTREYRWNDGIFESPTPDLQLMVDLVSAHYSAQRDELASVFSDVGYTLQRIKEYQDIRDADGRAGPELRSGATVAGMMFGIFQNVMSWHYIQNALHDLVDAARRCKEDPQRGQGRHQEYNLRLSTFQELIKLLFMKSWDDFRAFHVNSRTFTTSAERRQLKSMAVEPAWMILGYRSPEKFFQQDRLLCLLDFMMNDYRNVAKVLLELHTVLEKKEQARRLTLKVWELISELGLLWRLIEVCWYQQPAIPRLGKEDSSYLRSSGSHPRWCHFFRSLMDGDLPEATKKGGDLDRHFRDLKVARHSGVRNATWLNLVDEQQAKLQSGAELARKTFLATLQCGGANKQLQNHVLSILTPDCWNLTHPVSLEERARILWPPKKIGQTLASYIPPPQREVEPSHTSRNKRRGEIILDKDRSTEEPGQAAPQQPAADRLAQEHFTLSARAYRVVNCLFHHEGQRRIGSSTFTEVGQFMSEVGFAQYPTGGSAYTFLKPSDGVRERRSIVFHTHHNTSSYEGYELRRMGHRLTKHFGWTAETFTQA